MKRGQRKAALRGARVNPTDMMTGIQNIGEGWWPIVDALEADLNLRLGGNWSLVQIKEKFGGLRYWPTFITDNQPERDPIWQRIYEAEAESFHVCEQCGTREGVTTESIRGWLLTLCPQHRAERASSPEEVSEPERG